MNFILILLGFELFKKKKKATKASLKQVKGTDKGSSVILGKWWNYAIEIVKHFILKFLLISLLLKNLKIMIIIIG